MTDEITVADAADATATPVADDAAMTGPAFSEPAANSAAADPAIAAEVAAPEAPAAAERPHNSEQEGVQVDAPVAATVEPATTEASTDTPVPSSEAPAYFTPAEVFTLLGGLRDRYDDAILDAHQRLDALAQKIEEQACEPASPAVETRTLIAALVEAIGTRMDAIEAKLGEVSNTVTSQHEALTLRMRHFF